MRYPIDQTTCTPCAGRIREPAQFLHRHEIGALAGVDLASIMQPDRESGGACNEANGARQVERRYLGQPEDCGEQGRRVIVRAQAIGRAMFHGVEGTNRARLASSAENVWRPEHRRQALIQGCARGAEIDWELGDRCIQISHLTHARGTVVVVARNTNPSLASHERKAAHTFASSRAAVHSFPGHLLGITGGTTVGPNKVVSIGLQTLELSLTRRVIHEGEQIHDTVFEKSLNPRCPTGVRDLVASVDPVVYKTHAPVQVHCGSYVDGQIHVANTQFPMRKRQRVIDRCDAGSRISPVGTCHGKGKRKQDVWPRLNILLKGIAVHIDKPRQEPLATQVDYLGSRCCLWTDFENPVVLKKNITVMNGFPGKYQTGTSQMGSHDGDFISRVHSRSNDGSLKSGPKQGRTDVDGNDGSQDDQDQRRRLPIIE